MEKFKAIVSNINKNKYEWNMNKNGRHIWCIEAHAYLVLKAMWTFDFIEVISVLQNVQTNGSVLNWNYCKTGVTYFFKMPSY
jgi:hypothetical protein